MLSRSVSKMRELSPSVPFRFSADTRVINILACSSSSLQEYRGRGSRNAREKASGV